MEILRRDPSRVQGVIPLLAKLLEALADLDEAGTDDDVDDEGLAYLIGDSGGPDDS